MRQKISEEKKNIVILGAGFAGVRTALDLDNYLHDSDEYEIILIDRKDYQTFYPGLYEAASTEHGLVDVRNVKHAVTISLTDIFAKTKVKVVKAYVENIKVADGKVITDSRVVPFDYLVVAMGSIPDFYDIPNLDKYGYTLKNVEDAIMIRNRVEDLVVNRDSAQIVVGGGGFTGVEFVGELHNLIKHECKDHQKDAEKFKLVIMEASTNYLPGMSEKVSEMVGNRLTQMKIEPRFSSLITEVEKDSIIVNMKERVNCDLLIWAGGVRSCLLPFDIELERDKKDRILTTTNLNLHKFPNVFIAGDNVCLIDPTTKKPVPQTVPEAINQARLVAKNVYRLIKGKTLVEYSPVPLRYIIPVAGKFAILYSPNIIISGFAGWLIRQFVDLRYFMSILPIFKALKLWLFENKIFIKND